jgi:hypothetical protein
MSKFCHHPRRRDGYGTLLTSGREDSTPSRETEKLLGRPRMPHYAARARAYRERLT